MLAKVFEVLQGFVQAVAVAVLITEVAAEGTGAKGAEKKAQAIAKLREIFPPERLGGASWVWEPLANFLIDAVVAYANAKGFFVKSA